jgi:UDP-N-acetylmuramoyl-L-alanyl-D-glutamate--2,6-diaminopimelate ligase
MPISFDALSASIPVAELVGSVRSARPPAPIVDLTHDSRQVAAGWAYACVVGTHHDGHTFAAGAVEAGASALLVERPLALDVDQLIVADVRRVIGFAAAAVHGEPALRVRTVGITGTNGKTTTTHMLAAILRSVGVSTRQIGTLSGARTTPEAADLQRTLAAFVDEGVEAVVMEVSSHALALHRVAGMRFDVAVFTNLGRDHLDLHESMEAYFRAKASLFAPELSEVGVTNVDDPHGRLLLDAAPIPMSGYGADDLGRVDVRVDSIAFDWRGHRVTVPIGGHVNVWNAVAALSAAVALGIDAGDAARGLATCPPVPGRFEVVSDAALDPFAVVVDYAHTPDGLIAVLRSARQMLAPRGGGRVIVVFGCGGDRDAEKRPLMGAAASGNADVVVVTSDNPRHEDPTAIIAAAVSGVDRSQVGELHVEVDRRRAIELALGAARHGDIVVIAGKGHEATQTIGDTAHPFDDRTVARELIAGLRSPIPSVTVDSLPSTESAPHDHESNAMHRSRALDPTDGRSEPSLGGCP